MAINCHNHVINYRLFLASFCIIVLYSYKTVIIFFLAPLLSAYSGIRAAVIGSHWLCLQPTLSAFPTPVLLLASITTPSICICILFACMLVFKVCLCSNKILLPNFYMFLNFGLRKKASLNFGQEREISVGALRTPPQSITLHSAWSVWCGTKYQQKAKSVLLQNINKKRHHKYTN